MKFLLLFSSLFLSVLISAQTRYDVSSQVAFNTAQEQAVTGDTIAWEQGTYSDINMTIDKDGLIVTAIPYGTVLFKGASRTIINADNITLRLLIQHRSGIPNFTDAPNFWESPTKTFEESLALIENRPSNFEPGEDYEYCNTNYLLINKIMDDLLGFDNFQFIKKEVLIPLNLNNTFGSIEEVNLENVMSGYHVGHSFDLKADEHGMLATAKEVGIFLRALNEGTLFESGEKEIYDSIYVYEHSGWVPGYQSFAKYDSDLDAVLVQFYSTTDPKLYNWHLSEIINNRIVRIIEKQH